MFDKFAHLDHLDNATLRDMRDGLHQQGLLILAMDLNNFIHLRPSADVWADNFDDDMML